MKERIYYLHIPKAAGATMIQILRQIYPDSLIYRFYTTDVEGSYSLLKSFSAKRKKKIKIVAGHFSFGFHNYFENESFKYFTILRNPIERVISHYYYALRTKNHYLYNTIKDEKMTLIDYVKSGKCNEVNNGITKQIAGLYINDNFGYYKIIKKNMDNEELYNLAIKNIEKHFFLVGFVEYFNLTLFLLKKHIGGNLINYKYTIKNENTNKVLINNKKYKISNKEENVIIDYNKNDIKLYKTYLKLFDEKIKNIDRKYDFDKLFTPNFFEHYYLAMKRNINYFL